MMDAVHRFEGTVNQVLGDGIMALSGAPIAHEDHALRACYAALTMQVAYQSLLTSTRQRYHAQLAQALAARPETVETQPELLAHHATEAGLAVQAVEYWQRAGERSNVRSAYVETVAHLSRGLEALHTLPDTPARAQQEMAMQLTLAQGLVATKGRGAPERGHTFARARELCLQVEDTPQLCRVLAGLAGFHQQRGDLQRTRELREQSLALAQNLQDPALRMSAYSYMGLILYFLGELTAAQEHMEQAIGLSALQPDRTLPLGVGGDTMVMSLGYTAWMLW
jgi:predicted ATPase